MSFQQNQVVFDGTSATSSTFTSNSVFLGDYDIVTLSVSTSDGVASRLTMEGSNDNGFRTSINTWSNITTFTGPGIYSITPGVRWARFRRSSLDSLGYAAIQGKSNR